MAKRKRNPEELGTRIIEEPPRKQQQHLNGSANGTNSIDDSVAIQIVTGSYDRTLHGVVAFIPQNALRQVTTEDQVTFNDTFLIEAHASAVRCLALSPPSDSPDPRQQKVILASGSTDERISLYSLSTCRPAPGARPNLSSAADGAAIENPKNREMGSLLHHAASVNALYFPTKSKLLSGADDNTIAVSRTRDWTVLSTIKAPLPKIAGRPSGDTAGPGDVPTGINDFAVHPSMKVMVSVSKGERCMRLWNLVTGKKAGVLTFERPLLQQVGEGKHSRGEGLKIKWNAAGEDFVVGFERGAAIFGMVSFRPARMDSVCDANMEPGLKTKGRHGTITAYQNTPNALSPRRSIEKHHCHIYRGRPHSALRYGHQDSGHYRIPCHHKES